MKMLRYVQQLRKHENGSLWKQSCKCKYLMWLRLNYWTCYLPSHMRSFHKAIQQGYPVLFYWTTWQSQMKSRNRRTRNLCWWPELHDIRSSKFHSLPTASAHLQLCLSNSLFRCTCYIMMMNVHERAWMHSVSVMHTGFSGWGVSAKCLVVRCSRLGTKFYYCAMPKI